MDDDQKDVKSSAGEEASISDSSPDESKAPEDLRGEDQTIEPTGDIDLEAATNETEDSSKKGANQRIRELNAKAKREKDRADSLSARLAELTSPVGLSGQQSVPQYRPQVTSSDEEISVEELERRILNQAEARADLRIKQSEAIQRINREAYETLHAHPELDPDSDSFDKELSDSITEATLAHVQANPYSASPKKFVDKLMKPYRRAVTNEVGRERENLAKQVSQSATRPTSVQRQQEKSDAELSIEELEKKYGVVY